MKFELLYFIAEIRGLFPEIYKPHVSAHNLSKSEIKEIYQQTGWTLYRVSNGDASFIVK